MSDYDLAECASCGASPIEDNSTICDDCATSVGYVDAAAAERAKAAQEQAAAALDWPADGLVWIDAPGPDVIADPTGRAGTVRVGDQELTPAETRRLAQALTEAADVAEGKQADR